MKVADVLSDLPGFEWHAQAAKGGAPNLQIDKLYKLRAVCFPDTPVRQKVQELLDTEPAYAKGKKDSANRTSAALNCSTAIDLYLAEKQLHFADVCPLAGEGHVEENRKREQRFVAMTNEMTQRNIPPNYLLINVLKILRTHLYPLEQDGDLAILIDNATFDNGDSVGDGTKITWKITAPSLAKALAQGGVTVQDFVVAVRAAAEEGGTAKEKLSRFQDNKVPFPGSKLNYQKIIEALGSESSFIRMLQHILNNPGMANILPMLD